MPGAAANSQPYGHSYICWRTRGELDQLQVFVWQSAAGRNQRTAKFYADNTGSSPLSITGIGTTGSNPGDLYKPMIAELRWRPEPAARSPSPLHPLRVVTLRNLKHLRQCGGSPQHVSLPAPVRAMATLNPTNLSFGNQAWARPAAQRAHS